MKQGAEGDIALAPEAERRLRQFVALLLHWNPRINLISARDAPAVWERHVLDSLQLAPLLPSDAERLVDLGSGGGFPGLVLALATGRHADLVEADARKAAFLRTAVQALGAPASIHVARAEAIRLVPAPVVTARGVAPLPDLLALAAPFLAHGGVCLFPKGRSAEDELTRARREWHMRVERFPSRTSRDAILLRLREIRRVAPDG